MKCRTALVLAGLMGMALSAQMPRTVDVVPVTARAVMRARTLPGEFLPYESVPIYARVSGFVDRVLVDRGSQVRRGQPLLIIDAPEMLKVSVLQGKRRAREIELAARAGRQRRQQRRRPGRRCVDEMCEQSRLIGCSRPIECDATRMHRNEALIDNSYALMTVEFQVR